MQADIATAISFRQSTEGNTKLKGAYNLRDQWAQEPRDAKRTVTKKVSTLLNIHVQTLNLHQVPNGDN